jgi:hypothetical protein
MFLYGRVLAMHPYLRSIGEDFWDPDSNKNPAATPSLAMACAVGDLQFVASRASLEATPIAEVPATAKSQYRSLRLYQCPAT